MSKAVFDASTLLALMLGEPTVSVAGFIRDAEISAVNFAEVMTKVEEYEHIGREVILQDILAALNVVPFTEEQARLVADLRSATRHLGLSLGDRCCLALGISTGAIVYTADRAWLRLDLPCEVRSIRPD